MKKVILTVLSLAVFVFAYAQKRNDSPQETATKRVAKLDEVVGGLSNHQKAQAYQLFEGKFSEIQTIKSNDALTEQQRKEKVKGVRKSSKQEMSSILDSDQMDKWKAYKREKRQKKEGKSPESRTQKVIDEMDSVVGLSEVQKTQLRPVLTQKFKGFKEVKQNSSLSDDQKKEQKKKIRKESKKEVNSVLTSDQSKKWKAYKKEKKADR